jgi:di/tricarboxylate transporter
LIGRTLKGLRFRQRYGLQVLGINRRGKNIYSKLSEIVLRTGDQLLVQGTRANIAALDKENVFRILGAVDIQRPKRDRAPLAIAIFAGVLLLAAFNILELPVAVWLGALLVFATDCISPNTAYRAIEWKALMVIGSMLAIGQAMEYTGAAEFIATQIIGLTTQASPAWLLSMFFALTMLLTQPMSNQAAAVIVLPIALETALKLGLNPRTFAIMIAVGASCSFITPLEPACLMVYGPGRYKFADFIKVGLILTLLIYGIAIVMVPWLWPL